MSETFEIVRLGAGDAARMEAVNALFAEVFDDPASYALARPDGDYLQTVLSKDHVVVLAAEAEGRPIGALVAYELEKLEQARSEFYIYDLAVLDQFRRRGVATGLIAELQKIAHARGAWMIFVQADYGDDPAIALYEKLGAREEVLHFDIRPAP
jgi:aminoglycoside 3-N-acetyltransferase I